LDLFGDASAGSVHQIDEGYPQPRGLLLDSNDLLDGLFAPRASLDRVVVGHDAYGTPADHADTGDDAVGRCIGLVGAREEPVFLELGARIEQELESIADEELSFLAELVAVLRVTLLDPRALLEVAFFARAHRRLPITDWGWSKG